MSHLSRFFEKAFTRSNHQSRYSLSPWSIVFVDRTWDTHFEIFFDNLRIASGNTSDKELVIESIDQDLVQKVMEDFVTALPDYKVKITERRERHGTN